MTKTKELREAFVAGALYESSVLMGKNVSGDVGGEAIRRYPAKTTTRLREIGLPSRTPAPLEAKYRYNTITGEIFYRDPNGDRFNKWLSAYDTQRLIDLAHDPWETVEVDE